MSLYYLVGGFFGYWPIFILLIIVFVKLHSLNARVKNLSTELDNLKAKGVTPSVQRTTSEPVVPLETVVKNVVTVKEPVASGNMSSTAIEDWFKENLILKVGVLLVLMGVGWFVSYAFIHNWIGPVGRITLGLLTGGILTVLGTFKIEKNDIQGKTFMVLGTAIAVLSLLAGEYYYQFFSPTVTLILIFIISLYTGLTALAYSKQELAIYGILISLVAPYLSHTTNIDQLVLQIYLLVTSLGIIWISTARNWPKINAVGITGILLYALPYFTGWGIHQYSSKYALLFVGYITSLSYLSVSLTALVKNREVAGSISTYITAVNTAMILGLTTAIVPAVYQSLFIVVWMFVYAISGYSVFVKTQNEKLFYIHALSAILMLGVATSIELSGQTLVIAFIIESAILTLSSYIVTNNVKVAQNFFLLSALPFIMSLGSLQSSSWRTGVLHSDFVVLALMALSLLVLGMFYRSIENHHSESKKFYPIAFIGSSFYIYAIIWLSSHALLPKNPDTAVFISLFIYTISGLSAYFSGVTQQNKLLKTYGTTLVLCVVARLVVVDVWNMDLALRVVTFVVIGVMFISAGFVSKKPKLA